jgi:hypothetical protein
MRSIEEWTDDNHAAFIARLMDVGAVKTSTEYAAMKEIANLRELLSQAHGDLATIAAEPTPDETSERLVAVYRSIAEAAMKRYLDARWAWRNL